NSIFNREELLGRTIDQLNLRGTFSRIVRLTRGIDDKGTRANGLVDWYRRGVFPAVGRLGLARWVTIGVFLLALIGGIVVGQMPEWRLPLAQDTPLSDAASLLGRYTSLPT